MHKLLLADDSATIQRVIELTFSGEDVKIIGVPDGEQAIARIPAERPDIVLADIGMPKRSGYEVAAFVKGRPDLRHIPVLLLAGAFEPVDDAKAEQAGCDGVLVKPFEPQHVVSRVRELLDGAKGSPTQAAAPTVARPVEKLTRAAGPEPPAGAARADASLDAYFERLDTTLTARNGKASSIAADPDDSGLGVPTIDKVLSRDAVRPTPVPSNQSQAGPPKPVPPIDLPVDRPPVVLTPLPAPIAAPPIEPPETPPTMAPSLSRAVAGPSGPGGRSDVTGVQPDSRNENLPIGRSIVSEAFTALLALEEGEPEARPVRLTTAPEQPVITDALVNELVRRVVERLAPETARAVVADVVSEIAERLVREEIARIRSRQ